MTILPLMLSPLLALQGVGETRVAVQNDNPETWTLEYPRLIQPFVEDYRRCLRADDRRVTGRPDFEQQHREDLPRCADEYEEAQESALAIIAGRQGYENFDAATVRNVFDTIGRIHIARGADLDAQFRQNMASIEASRETYEAERPRGLVMELRDASVVRARTDATAPDAQTEEPGPEGSNVNN